jgi:general secretion pathway protein G
MNTKRGFTLIELLVVIAIIGILSSVVLASLNTARMKSRDTRRVADVKQLQIALALYYDANSQYPTTLAPLATNGYIAVLPKDPVSGSNYAYSALGSGATCSSYHLAAAIEDSTNQALNNDGDFAAGTACTGSAADFNGNATSCSGTTAASTDACYDVKP